jgi:ketosteroid isomerase-like protein
MRFPTLLKTGVVASLLLAAALAATPSAARSALSAQQSVSETNRQIVDRAFDRWTAGGSDFFTEVLSPDVIWTIEGSGPSAGVHRGLKDFTTRAVEPFVSRLAEPVRPVAHTVWADGDHVIVRWEGRAVARDGQPYQNDYVWIFRLVDGKAVEVTAFLDLAPYDDILRRVPRPDRAN